MEQYLLDIVVRYQTLIQRFKPSARKATGNDTDKDASITVTTPIRPLLDDEISSGQVVATFPRGDGSGVIDLHELKRVVRGLPTMNVSPKFLLSRSLQENRPKIVSFAFKSGRIFDADKTTEMIYEETAKPLLPYAWQGNIGTPGIERLIAKSLFDGTLSGERKIHISIFELAGNFAFDLLNSRAPFMILEDALGSTQLVGIQEHHVQNTDDLLVLVESANKFRQTASTEKNDGSSRSHAICRIRIENPAPEAVEDGILYLIDLAGSEMAQDIFNHATDRVKETREINISLSILKDCIRGMAEFENTGKSSKKPYIPFRQSTLSKVLKHLFDPEKSRRCKISVLAYVNPSFLDTGATKNTLRNTDYVE
ncbi:hypothetical protein N7488_006587 [Penicillium malachiteum]|nr:hypothetical protein N7488_006587 [Penicillium malachiteum]